MPRRHWQATCLRRVRCQTYCMPAQILARARTSCWRLVCGSGVLLASSSSLLLRRWGPMNTYLCPCLRRSEPPGAHNPPSSLPSLPGVSGSSTVDLFFLFCFVVFPKTKTRLRSCLSRLSWYLCPGYDMGDNDSLDYEMTPCTIPRTERSGFSGSF